MSTETVPLIAPDTIVQLNGRHRRRRGMPPSAEWRWTCPGCGGECYALQDEHATRDEIAADARCGTCRGL